MRTTVYVMQQSDNTPDASNAPSPGKVALSVVIPAYNEEGHIGGCLQSLQDQQIPADEIIVVDNNSTDGTAAVAASFKGVKVIPEPKQGISNARAAGFNAASGDIIARIDADSIARPDWTSRIFELLKDPSISAVSGNAALTEFSPPGKFWAQWYFRSFRRWHERSIGISPVMYGYNCAMKKQVWQDIKDDLTLGDSQISEDLDVTCAAAKRGHNILFSPSLIVKTPLRRSLSLEKSRRYYRTDGYTLTKHQMGNEKRWAADPA